MIIAVGALLFVLGILVMVYTRPPTRSSVALRRRLDELEELTDRTHVELKRLIKRYRSLEGHVYGSFESDDDDDDVAGEAPVSADPAAVSLTPPVPNDFPEDAFQDMLAKRRQRA